MEGIDDIDCWKQDRYEEKKEVFCQNNPEEDIDKDCYDSYQEWMEDEIGTVDDVDEPEELSLYDYIDKCSLGDVKFEVDHDLDIVRGRILFACGGPTVWVHDDMVCGYWGGDKVEMFLNGEASECLLDYIEELFQNCLDSYVSKQGRMY